MDDKLLKSAKKGKKRVGQTDLINYLQGKTLTQRKAIRAKCYDCNGMGELADCDIEDCSLFPFSPYNASCKRLGEKTQNKVSKPEKAKIISGSATSMDAPAVEMPFKKELGH